MRSEDIELDASMIRKSGRRQSRRQSRRRQSRRQSRRRQSRRKQSRRQSRRKQSRRKQSRNMKLVGGGLRAGSTVQVHGLQGAPQHNGKHGTVVKFIANTGRYEVRLDGEADHLSIKASNLLPLNDELPEGWGWDMDPKSGRTYYYDLHTKETTWNMPKKVTDEVMRKRLNKTKNMREWSEGLNIKKKESRPRKTTLEGSLTAEVQQLKEKLSAAEARYTRAEAGSLSPSPRAHTPQPLGIIPEAPPPPRAASIRPPAAGPGSLLSRSGAPVMKADEKPSVGAAPGKSDLMAEIERNAKAKAEARVAAVKFEPPARPESKTFMDPMMKSIAAGISKWGRPREESDESVRSDWSDDDDE